jgi:hypothetical protein
MLVKINDVDTSKNSVKVTQLDIDDYGSIIPLRELELNISADKSILQTLRHSSYAAIFTAEDDQITIILATGMTLDELNQEKSRTINKASKRSK